MAFRKILVCTALASASVPGLVLTARADGESPASAGLPGLAAPAGGGSSAFTNSAATAVGLTPSGVSVTVSKTMLGKSRVTSAAVLPANPLAPDDEYLFPANAKVTAGFVDLYENFTVKPGSWGDVATLTFTFTRPVRDPLLHIFGMGGSAGDAKGRRDDFWPAIDLVSGTPAKPAFSQAAGFPGYRVTANSIEPERVYLAKSTTCGVVYTCGTAKVNGTVTSFTVKLRARDVRHGITGMAPQLWAAVKLSLTEDDSDAPATYGAASHAISDSYLGKSVTADHRYAVSLTPRALPSDTDDDDALTGSPVPITSDGRNFTVKIPVTAASAASVAGWIDFDHNGRFDATERSVANVAKGASTVELSWAVPQTLQTGPTWMRLRLAADANGTALSTGWADSGEVEDHQVQLVQLVQAESTVKPAS
ncbi:GEVED domain-containing protein [Nonomuraea sp. NPDC046802]|uniref:GEVED domain-containing protein n=1 Tax=Nonomuraea sp. NPDC046802 TaxID=3154919 RepID=UPI0033F7A0EE